jgi:hypothetical protein
MITPTSPKQRMVTAIPLFLYPKKAKTKVIGNKRVYNLLAEDGVAAVVAVCTTAWTVT